MEKSVVCTGCGCLCNDITIRSKKNNGFEVQNACRRGKLLIEKGNSHNGRAKNMVKGKESDKEAVLYEALEILRRSRKLIIFGLDNSTIEAQIIAINLSQKLGAIIDDCSTFCHGSLIKYILEGGIPSCSLSMAKECDLIIYWGSNPLHSHPRHLSLYSYYSHETFSARGWVPEVTLCSIEVRGTELTRMCDRVFKIKPREDKRFIESVLSLLKGKGATDESKDFIKLIEKAKNTIIFVGLGLTYSLEGDYELFGEMVESLNQVNMVYSIPMVGHYNMRGFNHELFKATGYVNKVSFRENPIKSDKIFSFLEQIANEVVDCVLIIGSDPLSSLPYSIAKKLLKIPIILIDPMVNLTTSASYITIPVAISGIETDGSAIRMDGEKVNLTQIKTDKEYMSDADVLKLFLEGVSS